MGALVRVISGAAYKFDWPDACALASHDLFVANGKGNSVTELDATTGALVWVISDTAYKFNSPDALASSGGHLSWLMASASLSLSYSWRRDECQAWPCSSWASRWASCARFFAHPTKQLGARVFALARPRRAPVVAPGLAPGSSDAKCFNLTGKYRSMPQLRTGPTWQTKEPSTKPLMTTGSVAASGQPLFVSDVREAAGCRRNVRQAQRAVPPDVS